VSVKRFEFSVLTATSTAFLDKLIDAIRKALPGPLLQAFGTLAANREIDLSVADLTTLTLGANLTLTLATAKTGTSAFLELAQDGVGARTVTLSGSSGLAAWTMTATANKKDMLFLVRTTTTWVGTIHAQNY